MGNLCSEQESSDDMGEWKPKGESKTMGYEMPCELCCVVVVSQEPEHLTPVIVRLHQGSNLYHPKFLEHIMANKCSNTSLVQALGFRV